MINSFETLFEARERKFQQERLFRGESVDLIARITTDGLSDILTDYSISGIYQPTDELNGRFYSLSAEIRNGKAVLHWTRDNDFGKSAYNVWGLLTKGGEVAYPICWRLDFAPSPSYPVSPVDPLPKTIDFAEYVLVNAPWQTSSDVQEELESFCVLSSPCLSLEKAKGLSQTQIDALAKMGIPFTDYKLTLEKTYPTQPANEWSVCIDGMDFGVARTHGDPRTIVFDNGVQQLIGPEEQGFWVPGQTVLGYLVSYAALSVGETSVMVELASDVNAKQIARLDGMDAELSVGLNVAKEERLFSEWRNGRNLVAGYNSDFVKRASGWENEVFIYGREIHALSGKTHTGDETTYSAGIFIGSEISNTSTTKYVGSNIAIGNSLNLSGRHLIVIGDGRTYGETESTSVTDTDAFYVWDKKMLDKTTGEIPQERIPYLSDYATTDSLSSYALTSAIPLSTSQLINDSGFLSTQPDLNYLPYSSASGGVALQPTMAVYRYSASVNPDTNEATLYGVTTEGIPSRDAYFCFEMEISISASATGIDSSMLSVTWLKDGELPTSDFAGKTLFIACRLDCNTRTILANCWRVA